MQRQSSGQDRAQVTGEVQTVVRPRAGADLSGDAGVRTAYDAYGAEIYRFAVRKLGDTGMAQDAVQETFLRAWLAARRYDARRSSLRVWLFAIARNVVVDLHRKRTTASWAPVHSAETRVESGAGSAAPDLAETVTTEAVVVAALHRISDDHREVIVETYLKGRSYDDLAAESGVAPGTLRSRMFYAMKALRCTLDEMGISLQHP